MISMINLQFNGLVLKEMVTTIYNNFDFKYK